MFITNGGIADLVFVAARTDPTAKGSRGISIFAVEKDTPGFKASRALEKMGWHSSDTAELVFEDVWVPESNLVGEENRGFYYIMSNFQNERLAIMGQGLGESQRALELTIEHVKQTERIRQPAVGQAGDPTAGRPRGRPRSTPGGSSPITPPGSSTRARTPRGRSRR